MNLLRMLAIKGNQKLLCYYKGIVMYTDDPS